MSTIDATVSMLETMPEEARILVYRYTQELFSSRRPASPFTPVSTKQVLADLEESRQQIKEGKGMKMDEALNDLGRRHGFI